jgi:hypothetical protein
MQDDFVGSTEHFLRKAGVVSSLEYSQRNCSTLGVLTLQLIFPTDQIVVEETFNVAVSSQLSKCKASSSPELHQS